MRVLRVLVLGGLIALQWGCGSQEGSRENYSLKSTADLTLTQQNHPHGFAQSECFHCHVRANIHQVNRLNTPLTELARTLVEQSGLTSCRGCHGGNGL